jgi:hypothetical protein
MTSPSTTSIHYLPSAVADPVRTSD